jgi:drug/metabolite transporter (DMT)-like permease
VWWGVLVALCAAVFSGTAAVVQAVAARSVPDTGRGVHVHLLLDLTRRWRFWAGLGLDLASFVATFTALRVSPVFLVQAVTSANLAVTAVVARRVLGTHLGRIEKTAVVAVCAGLVLLGVFSGRQGPSHGDDGLHATLLHATLLGAVAVLAVLGWLAGRLPPRAAGAVLGLLAGCGFGLTSLASRVVDPSSVASLAADPVTWVFPTAGFLAFLFYATALQRESVTAATAGTVVGQTVFPALVGLFVLHDEVTFGALALAGFLVTILGALTLARFGDLSEDIPIPDPARPTSTTGG